MVIILIFMLDAKMSGLALPVLANAKKYPKET